MKQKKKRITPFSLTVIILVIIAIAVVSFVNAAYIKHSNDVNNVFKPADSIIPDIDEDFDGALKKDVYFEVGETEYPVYVRAEIVVTWQDLITGVVYYKPVEPEDYFISLNTEDWEKIGNYYYYKDVVASNGTTLPLIYECYQINEAPAEGYTLSVEIIVQTVQAVGYTDGADNMNETATDKTEAWKDAWGIS